jgi:hypothetical protein
MARQFLQSQNLWHLAAFIYTTSMLIYLPALNRATYHHPIISWVHALQNWVLTETKMSWSMLHPHLIITILPVTNVIPCRTKPKSLFAKTSSKNVDANTKNGEIFRDLGATQDNWYASVFGVVWGDLDTDRVRIGYNALGWAQSSTSIISVKHRHLILFATQTSILSPVVFGMRHLRLDQSTSLLPLSAFATHLDYDLAPSCTLDLWRLHSCRASGSLPYIALHCCIFSP